ncbi:MAG: NAD-dependent succinate-semialdehyde dehydrogenase [Gammaproteobacteria bacterium]
MTDIKNNELWKTGALIDGVWLDAVPGGSYPILNPATGESLANVPRCGADETTHAIEAADRALPGWRDTTAKQRSKVLRRWHDLMLQERDVLARLITLEQGKPLAESRGEVAYAASFIEWFAEEAKRIRGDVLEAPRPSQRLLVLKQPVGVCAAITPWNFPSAMVTRKVAPALAAGCTIVLKPSPETPLSALALAELALQADVPAGVFNVVTGDDAQAIGAVLTEHPTVRKVSFTGSTQVGRHLLRQSADTVKRVSMELGGNAPFVIFDDADLDAAVDGLMGCKYRNAGQTCVSANRVLVHERIQQAFARLLADKVAAIRVGNGMDRGVQQGPMINEAAVAKAQRHVTDAVAAGAQLVIGGSRHELGGAFFEPTVLSQVPVHAQIAVEESFSPVTPLLSFASESEAIAMANNTEFGLAAYLYSSDAARIWRVSEALEAGMVGVNCGVMSNDVAPFGGVKQSGLGREGSHYGIEEYMELKYVCWDGL